MNPGADIAKAGWLFRQSTVLHRWKRNWFVLYRDGLLRYFETPDSPRAEDVFILRSACKQIKTGTEVRSASPPEEVREGKSCMLELDLRDGSQLVLCADTCDDMRAWQMSLEEARTMPPPGGPAGFSPMHPSHVPLGYSYQSVPMFGGYPGQVISQTAQSAPTAQVVQTPHGMTTIINQAPQMVYVQDDPYRNRYGRHRYGHRGQYCNRGTTYVATPRYW
ncbi:hypothetical protein ACOMHN_025639 [Nucella lapillus]